MKVPPEIVTHYMEFSVSAVPLSAGGRSLTWGPIAACICDQFDRRISSDMYTSTRERIARLIIRTHIACAGVLTEILHSQVESYSVLWILTGKNELCSSR